MISGPLNILYFLKYNILRTDGPDRSSQECHILQMSGGVRAQLILELLFALWLLLSMHFSCRVKTHLGKQEESNTLPSVSKNGKRVVGYTVIEYLLCVGMGLLHVLTSLNLCNDPMRRCWNYCI